MDLSFIRLDTDSVIPLWRQIASGLRDAIGRGELRHNEELPGEIVIARTLGVSRGPVLDAIEDLAASGHVWRGGRGKATRIRQPPETRVLSTGRYLEELYRLRLPVEQRQQPSTYHTRDENASWLDYHVDGTLTCVPATEHMARVLDVDAGTLVWRRFIVEHVRHVPVQLRVTLTRYEPETDPGMWRRDGGALAELHAAGYQVTSVGESLMHRTPSSDECEALNIDRALCVFEMTRRFTAMTENTRVQVVIAADELVFPAQGIRWEWCTPLWDAYTK